MPHLVLVLASMEYVLKPTLQYCKFTAPTYFVQTLHGVLPGNVRTKNIVRHRVSFFPAQDNQFVHS